MSMASLCTGESTVINGTRLVTQAHGTLSLASAGVGRLSCGRCWALVVRLRVGGGSSGLGRRGSSRSRGLSGSRSRDLRGGGLARDVLHANVCKCARTNWKMNVQGQGQGVCSSRRQYRACLKGHKCRQGHLEWNRAGWRAFQRAWRFRFQ